MMRIMAIAAITIGAITIMMRMIMSKPAAAVTDEQVGVS